MDWVKIATPKEDSFRESGVPYLPCGEKHVWVRKLDIDKIAEIIGKRPRQAQYQYGMFEGIRAHPGTPIMVVVHTIKEIIDVFGLKNVFVKHQNDQVGTTTEGTDPRNLFIFTDHVPGGNSVKLEKNHTKISIDGIEMKIPVDIQKTFKKATRDPRAHKILDDNGLLLGYAKDNRIWITFNIGGVEGGRDNEWYPSVLLQCILRRGLPLGYSNKEAVSRTDEERLAELERAREEWVKIWVQDTDQRLKNLKEEFNTVQTNFRDCMVQIAESQKRMDELNRQILFEETTENHEERAKQEFAQVLRDIAELELIEFKKDGSIMFRTSMINIEEDVSQDPFEFEPFELGEFEITCKPGCTPKIRNLTKVLEYDGGKWDAPHAQRDNPCFGNIGADIARYSGQRRWRDVIKLVIEYLKNVTAKDDVWGRKGFERWKDAAKEATAQVKDKDTMVAPLSMWASHVPTIRNYNLMTGARVCAICPNSCGLKDQKEKDDSPKCKIQGTGERLGVVKTMLDYIVHVEWETTDEKGKKIKADCMGFTYDSILREDGLPLYEGDSRVYISPEKRKAAQALVDTVEAANIRLEAEDFQYLPPSGMNADCSTPDMTVEELARVQNELVDLFDE